MSDSHIVRSHLGKKVLSLLLVVLALCVGSGAVETASSQTSQVFVGAGDIAGA